MVSIFIYRLLYRALDRAPCHKANPIRYTHISILCPLPTGDRYSIRMFRLIESGHQPLTWPYYFAQELKVVQKCATFYDIMVYAVSLICTYSKTLVWNTRYAGRALQNIPLARACLNRIMKIDAVIIFSWSCCAVVLSRVYPKQIRFLDILQALTRVINCYELWVR